MLSSKNLLSNKDAALIYLDRDSSPVKYIAPERRSYFNGSPVSIFKIVYPSLAQEVTDYSATSVINTWGFPKAKNWVWRGNTSPNRRLPYATPLAQETAPSETASDRWSISIKMGRSRRTKGV